MQALTASPRDTLTAAQVTSVLQADSLVVVSGLELLDSNDALVSDISVDLADGEVDRANDATVHGTCKLKISRALQWGSARVRPYMTLTGNGLSARWNLGVYVLTTPDRKIGENPVTYEVAGYDKLYLLNQQIGDTYSVAAGTGVLTAVKAAITASGVGGSVLLDTTSTSKTLASDMVWPLTETSPPTYLSVINDLLATISYRGLWADQDGALRSEPYVNPSTRAVEWAFNADDPYTSLVGIGRVQTKDMWAVPNWWRFIQRGLATAPVEGTGQYTVTNQSDGATSINALGFTKRSVTFLDAADQASLQAQGDRIVQADKRVSETLKVTTAPFPGVGHFDVYTYQDTELGGLVKVQASSWVLPLNGNDMSHTWEVVG